ncbi:hypothetical protein CPT_Seuss117 [Caulobacter phage Seuss]|uniref:Uncharacterized protein n=1 Tax=Caulobacter phage Seuss TaxID=1675601 RepID=A0A0K1LN50_9CAUD|nr:hypothetical protein HOR08_gp117 [Caulobacter phage Seuss]AKU43643.1 hypothetical protein CPT_Seuss117 [Caulobacter phage Seuss]
MCEAEERPKRGRKKQPIIQRLTRLLGRDLSSELRAASYPEPASECWAGPSHVFEAGRPHATARIVFTLLYSERIQRARLQRAGEGDLLGVLGGVPLEHLGINREHHEIDPTHHVRRICPTSGCCNPHHHRLHIVWSTTGQAPPPIPFEFIVQGEPDDLNDAIDTILMIEGGRSLTPTQLVARFHQAYDEQTFARALDVIREQGL